jgi:catechol 2,3-dioxygenase-like lactoylglutathione lyase family enzyme
MEIKNFRHVGIVTENLSQSLNFYKKIFGLKVVKTQIETDPSLAKIMGLKRVEVKTVKLKDEKSVVLELLCWRYPKVKKDISKKINSRGITHFAVTVKNIDIVLKKLKKFRNSTISKSELSADKKVKYAFCKTPEKIFIELVQVLHK